MEFTLFFAWLFMSCQLPGFAFKVQVRVNYLKWFISVMVLRGVLIIMCLMVVESSLGGLILNGNDTATDSLLPSMWMDYAANPAANNGDWPWLESQHPCAPFPCTLNQARINIATQDLLSRANGLQSGTEDPIRTWQNWYDLQSSVESAWLSWSTPTTAAKIVAPSVLLIFLLACALILLYWHQSNARAFPCAVSDTKNSLNVLRSLLYRLQQRNDYASLFGVTQRARKT